MLKENINSYYVIVLKELNKICFTFRSQSYYIKDLQEEIIKKVKDIYRPTLLGKWLFPLPSLS